MKGKDIATLGVAGVAIYAIYKIVNGGTASADVLPPAQAISANINPHVFTPAPPTDAAIGLAPNEIIEEGHALHDVFKTVWPTPPVTLAPSLTETAIEFLGGGPA